MPCSEAWGLDETARFHFAFERYGNRVATRRTRAAADDAGDRVPARRVTGPVSTFGGRVSTGLKRNRLKKNQNVAIEYRWAEDHLDRLPGMAADLVRRKVSVIAAMTTPAALAAEATATTIPIIFDTAGDLVRLGLVASLNRPGRNVTGHRLVGFRVGGETIGTAARSDT